MNNKEIATEILMERDPLLSISHPIRFNDIVSDMVAAWKEPHFSRAYAFLAPYGPGLILDMHRAIPWDMSNNEKLIISAHIYEYMMDFFLENEDLIREDKNLFKILDAIQEFANSKLPQGVA